MVVESITSSAAIYGCTSIKQYRTTMKSHGEFSTRLMGVGRPIQSIIEILTLVMGQAIALINALPLIGSVWQHTMNIYSDAYILYP